jgi:hypothetical protein
MKQVGNVSSKYYFQPNKLDEDYARRKAEHEEKKSNIKADLKALLLADPAAMEDSYRLIIETMIELKKEFSL